MEATVMLNLALRSALVTFVNGLGDTAPTVAHELRDVLAANGHCISDAMLNSDDPLHVLRLVAVECPEAAPRIAKALRDAELRAVDSARPTPGVADAIAAARSSGLALAVVSNNSHEAVERYLNRVDLRGSFTAVVGRYEDQSPSLLKPSPHLIEQALRDTEIPPRSAVLVGDSVTDVIAAKAAGVECVAFRPVEAELTPLVTAGAVAAVTSMHQLAEAIYER